MTTIPVMAWSVEDVLQNVSQEEWAEPSILSLLKYHSIDGQALLELTKDDLRYDFGILDLGRVKRILRSIARFAAASSKGGDRSVSPTDSIEHRYSNMGTRCTSTTPYDDEVRSVLRGFRAGTPEAVRQPSSRPTSSILKDGIPRPCSECWHTEPRGSLPPWARLAWGDTTASPSQEVSHVTALTSVPKAGGAVASDYPKLEMVPPVVGILESERRKERIQEVVGIIRTTTPDLLNTTASTENSEMYAVTENLDNVSFDRYIAQCLTLANRVTTHVEENRRRNIAKTLYTVWTSVCTVTAVHFEEVMTAVGHRLHNQNDATKLSPLGVDAELFACAFTEAMSKVETPEAYDVVVFRVERFVNRRRPAFDVGSDTLRIAAGQQHRVLVFHSGSSEPWACDPFDVVEKAAALASARLDVWYLTPGHADEIVRRKSVLENIKRGGFHQGRWVYVSLSSEYWQKEKRNAQAVLREVGLSVSTQLATNIHPKFRLYLFVPLENPMILPTTLLHKAFIVDVQNSKTAGVAKEGQ